MKDAFNTTNQAVREGFCDVGFLPAWRYWHSYSGKKHYCYTTEKCSNGKYVAFILSLWGKRWKVRKRVFCKLRWKAKDKAYEWLCKEKGKTFESLHVPVKRGRNNLQRALICVCNQGLEEYFDVDCEYLGQPHFNDKYLVEDRFGENRIMSRMFFKEKA